MLSFLETGFVTSTLDPGPANEVGVRRTSYPYWRHHLWISCCLETDIFVLPLDSLVTIQLKHVLACASASRNGFSRHFRNRG